MMLSDSFEPYYDKRLKLYVITLQEKVAESTPEEAKLKANYLMECYRVATGRVGTQFHKEISKIETENAELKKQNEKYKTALKTIAVQSDDEDIRLFAERTLKEGEK